MLSRPGRSLIVCGAATAAGMVCLVVSVGMLWFWTRQYEEYVADWPIYPGHTAPTPALKQHINTMIGWSVRGGFAAAAFAAVTLVGDVVLLVIWLLRRSRTTRGFDVAGVNA